ncbi:BZ3500_MvSof-1268-A1-R1_Chr8-1g09922 [Microbotryum saponariae]|uniref:BZ3500_MvSof-1268-A1-R1_Chr8-1g09922 protein n=1 Tax=Microbotryum saponariae TaxID=289078 RepID=A0A2X0LRT6_9BASI|nr:BZ3500_MvSof-1268-A1-R1_Chr8-1g09922 [Microbotryum saponariae]SDA08208.1 BZ3501_MvSof-1269-A2-R1_Chr8-1g09645 [Microbotryum saponariae]
MPSLPKVVPTNTLILLLPSRLFDADLLPMFETHFHSYGRLVSWTSLRMLGRVLVVYEDVQGATLARREMNGFVWEDDDDDQAVVACNHPATSPAKVKQPPSMAAVLHPDTSRPPRQHEPLRVFFGPTLALPLPSLHSTLLSVPALSRNFLISPPGSPPVGWEQTLEEAPNPNPLPEGGDIDHGWASELARALRYISVDTDPSLEPDADRVGPDDDLTVTKQGGSASDASTTQVIVPPRLLDVCPSITVSTAAENSIEMPGSLPARNISAVKATIDSLLERKRSFESLSRTQAASSRPESVSSYQRTISPTARPPLVSQED